MNILNKVTWKNLKKNRTRTLVTIIGIVLSVSLFTAVTTSVYSLQTYIVEVTKEKQGNYHGGILDVDGNVLSKIVSDEKAEMVTTLQNIGYARIDEIENADKPYLFIGGMDKEFAGMMPVHLLEGRLPESSREILLPEHLSTNGGVNYTLGAEITLEIGSRSLDGMKLGQTESFISDGEELMKEGSRTFTTIGFYERPSFEGFNAPGYSALTLTDGAGPDSFDASVRVDPMKDTYDFLE
ncbi:MAG TPA: ABC transporter permease, partial [Proteiniclasticum sp.]|nr:ABC transporter permease [Proteiniclasticum sp.]